MTTVANPPYSEFGISEFISRVGAKGYFAKRNRYTVEITPPSGLLSDPNITDTPDPANIQFLIKAVSLPARTLTLFGAKHKIFEDGIDIEGFGQSVNNPPFNSAEIDSYGDHRIAMASIIGALRSKDSCKVRNCSNISTSFPDFIDLSNRIGIILNKI